MTCRPRRTSAFHYFRTWRRDGTWQRAHVIQHLPGDRTRSCPWAADASRQLRRSRQPQSVIDHYVKKLAPQILSYDAS